MSLLGAKAKKAKEWLIVKISDAIVTTPMGGLGAVSVQCSTNGVCSPKNAVTKAKFEELQKQINRAATALKLPLSIISVDGVIGYKTLASIIKIAEKSPDTTWLATTFAIEIEESLPTTKFVADNVDKITILLAALVPPAIQVPATQPSAPQALPGTQQATKQPAIPSTPGYGTIPWLPENQWQQNPATPQSFPGIQVQAQTNNNWLIGLGASAGIILIGALIVAAKSKQTAKSAQSTRPRITGLSPSFSRGKPTTLRMRR